MSERTPTEAQVEAADQAWDRHGMTERADFPKAAAALLLKDAAEALNIAWVTIFMQDAVTDDILRLVQDAADMARDAYLIAAIDPDMEPKVGMVTLQPDGTFTWNHRIPGSGNTDG
jgi:acyl-CoA reductase-like NAD-dependent aldehyde dehydrogenase